MGGGKRRHPVEAGHVVVGEDEIEAAPAERLVEARVAVHAGQLHLEPALLELRGDELGIQRAVLQQEQPQRLSRLRQDGPEFRRGGPLHVLPPLGMEPGGG